MKNIVVAVLIILAGGGGFLVGRKYQERKVPSLFRERGMARGGAMVPRPNANLIRGEIIKRDEESLTVKQPDGTTKIVFFSEDTVITKSQEGELGDLKEGIQVAVFGQENSDKSLTAQTVQLNPALGGRLGRDAD